MSEGRMNTRWRFPIPAGLRTSSFVLPAVLLASLSSRLAADGNVRAFVDSRGTLVVVGDDADNRVVVGRVGGGGAFVVTGEVFTTVNGTDEVILSADDVEIFMRAGNDEARVDGAVPGFVHISGGAGNDRLSLGDPVVSGFARLDGGAGDDHLGVEGTVAAGGLRLIGGSGDDEVHLLSASEVRDRAVIELGAGDDVVVVFDHRIEGLFRIDGGSGADTVTIQDSTVTQDAVLVLSAGNDEVIVDGSVFGGRLKIALGSQDDALTIGG